MDSISFTFLAFASYTVALLLSAPLYRRGIDLRMLDTWELRRSPRVWLMAALFMVMIDMVVDPLSVLGDRWFLGRIFWYDRRGRISEFRSATTSDGISSRRSAWGFSSGWIAASIAAAASPGAVPAAPSRALWGPGLYAGVVGFAIVMLFRVGAPEIGWAGIFIFLPLLALGFHIVTRPGCRGDATAVERHLADFPYEPLLAVWNAVALPHQAGRRGAA